jgi:radical SAM superfamily enzyme YgiQ (UPF0313 family)
MTDLYTNATKCLFVQPKFSEHSFWNYRDVCRIAGARYPAAPLGLLTVAGLLPSHWELKLIDENVRTLSTKDLRWADLVMTGGMLPQQMGIKEVVHRARALGKPVVVGGADPTSQPHLYADADYRVLGEGEVSVPLFLDALREGKPTGTFVCEEKADMARAVIPRYDLIKFSDYMHMGIQCTRGCPFDCEFCDVVELFGRRPRTKTADHILAELDRLSGLGYRGHVDFVDDNFIGNRRDAVSILTAIRDWQRDHGFPFYFTTEASLNLAADEPLLELMRDCDFRYVFIGIETPEEEVYDKSAKKLNVNSTIADAVRKISSYGIIVNAGFIMGFDNETDNTAANMIACIQETGICMAMVGTLYALPNTRLTRRLRTEGRLFEANGIVEMASQDVDNTTNGLNFVTTRPAEAILQDYSRVLEYIYAPANYYERVKQTSLLLRSHAKHRPSFMATVKSLWSFVKLSTRVTFTPSVTYHYWRMVLGFLVLKPESLTTAVNLAAMYVHFLKQSRYIVKHVQDRIAAVPLKVREKAAAVE